MANGDNIALKLLDEHEQKVNISLKKPRLKSVERTLLEGQLLLVVFMRAYSGIDPETQKEDDRKNEKINTMWRTFNTGYRLLWILIPILIVETLAMAWDITKFGWGIK